MVTFAGCRLYARHLLPDHVSTDRQGAGSLSLRARSRRPFTAAAGRVKLHAATDTSLRVLVLLFIFPCLLGVLILPAACRISQNIVAGH